MPKRVLMGQMMKLLPLLLAGFVLQSLRGFLPRPAHVQQVTKLKPAMAIGVILQRTLAENEIFKPFINFFI
jgi:hypothetical protein